MWVYYELLRHSFWSLSEEILSGLKVCMTHHVVSVLELGTCWQFISSLGLLSHHVLGILVILTVYCWLIFPLDLILGDSWFLDKNMSGQSLNIWYWWWVFIEFLIFIVVVYIVTNSEELLVVVRAGQEETSDSNNLWLREHLHIRWLTLQFQINSNFSKIQNLPQIQTSFVLARFSPFQLLPILDRIMSLKLDQYKRFSKSELSENVLNFTIKPIFLKFCNEFFN